MNILDTLAGKKTYGAVAVGIAGAATAVATGQISPIGGALAAIMLAAQGFLRAGQTKTAIQTGAAVAASIAPIVAALAPKAAPIANEVGAVAGELGQVLG